MSNRYIQLEKSSSNYGNGILACTAMCLQMVSLQIYHRLQSLSKRAAATSIKSTYAFTWTFLNDNNCKVRSSGFVSGVQIGSLFRIPPRKPISPLHYHVFRCRENKVHKRYAEGLTIMEIHTKKPYPSIPDEQGLLAILHSTSNKSLSTS